MTAPAFEPPVIKHIGNVRDLLAMVCSPHADGWVLDFMRSGWRITICSMSAGIRGPFRMELTNPKGNVTKIAVGCPTVLDAVESAVTGLEAAGVPAQAHPMRQIALALDAR
jgi:hypothetical protein